MIIETIGKIQHIEKAERNGQPVGLLTGVLTTFVPNRPFDSRNLPKRFEKTSFDATIKMHKERSNRPVRLLLEHNDLIGGFPIDSLHTTTEGLVGIGEINLNTQIGQETFSLAQQGVLSDFSIGYKVIVEHLEQGYRIADVVTLFEVSIVAEPANQDAKITNIESLSPRELEKILMSTGKFNRTFVRKLAKKIIDTDKEEVYIKDFNNYIERKAIESLIYKMKECTHSLQEESK